MEKRRILFCVSRFLDGGIDIALVRYLAGLDPARYDAVLVIADEYAGSEVLRRFVPPSVRVVHLVGGGALTALVRKKVVGGLSRLEKIVEEVALRPVRCVLHWFGLRRLVRGAFAVVDFDAMQGGLLAGLRVRRVAFFHFSMRDYCHGKPRRLRRLGRKLGGYDGVAVVSEAMRREAVELFPEIAGKFATIYNPLDVAALRAAAAEYAVPPGEYILMVARINESQKDYTTLVRAYHAARLRHPALPPLRIVGKGPDEGRVRTLVRDLGEDGNVEFLGFLPNPMPWVAECSVFVLSSKFEGLAVVLTEALALGRTIVATDAPTGSREALDDGRCGILVPVGDVEAMAEALIVAVSDGALRRRCAEAAAHHCEKFAVAESLRRLEGLLG